MKASRLVLIAVLLLTGCQPNESSRDPVSELKQIVENFKTYSEPCEADLQLPDLRFKFQGFTYDTQKTDLLWSPITARVLYNCQVLENGLSVNEFRVTAYLAYQEGHWVAGKVELKGAQLLLKKEWYNSDLVPRVEVCQQQAWTRSAVRK